jgi:hypothetical protein
MVPAGYCKVAEFPEPVVQVQVNGTLMEIGGHPRINTQDKGPGNAGAQAACSLFRLLVARTETAHGEGLIDIAVSISRSGFFLLGYVGLFLFFALQYARNNERAE